MYASTHALAENHISERNYKEKDCYSKENRVLHRIGSDKLG